MRKTPRWPRTLPLQAALIARRRRVGGGTRAGWLELFYGLLFVALMAQLAEPLADHPGWPSSLLSRSGPLGQNRFSESNLTHVIPLARGSRP
ncbi:hypothetical protein [Streptomyces sp. NPDC046712]|uniref:hypothetical protein n=1 Tax=Streptomyces sp. NPDC046712 TaxID=3154802 RepID=UPI00340EEA9F